MPTYPQNSHVAHTFANQIYGTYDGSVSDEILNVYLDFLNLDSIPTFNGGASWHEYDIFAGGGNDKITAGHGDDNIYAGSGNDIVKSLYGYNFIDGGSGTDMLDYSWYGYYTSINNHLGVDADLAAGDAFVRESISNLRFNDEFVSIENLRGSSFNDSLYGDAGRNVIDGGYGNDLIAGRSGDDDLYGGRNNDGIYGGNGDDILRGGYGNDVLAGGLGADIMTGGPGYDRFVYYSAAESTVDLGSQDVIRDFTLNFDKIDFSRVYSGALFFLGTSNFTGLGGEVRFDTDGFDTFVQVDTNGDKNPNIEITLEGVLDLNQVDFIL